METLTIGVSQVLSSENIAIVTLMTVLGLSLTMNYYLIRGLLKMKDVLQALALAMAVLNERLHTPHDDKKVRKTRHD